MNIPDISEPQLAYTRVLTSRLLPAFPIGQGTASANRNPACTCALKAREWPKADVLTRTDMQGCGRASEERSIARMQHELVHTQLLQF